MAKQALDALKIYREVAHLRDVLADMDTNVEMPDDIAYAVKELLKIIEHAILVFAPTALEQSEKERRGTNDWKKQFGFETLDVKMSRVDEE